MDDVILVTGGTGTLGRPLVRRLAADGARVRVMSRRARPQDAPEDVEWATADLAAGTGLDAALDGVRTVVHAATNARDDVKASRHLVEAALRRPGAPLHLVYVSIVGIDAVPFPYYRSKLAVERLVEESGLPWTTLRATQFHDLVATFTLVQRWLPVALYPSGFRFQPVEVAEVADRLAELAQGAPAGRVADFAGPRIRDARELAAVTLRAAGRRRPLVPLRLPGKAFRGFRAGGNVATEPGAGKVTYEDYLAARF
ncbi:NAD(P)H-binding protein [Streptomyces sp. NPDC051940]|uniref:SDR family oxidoreductase n=1 Tax=Streptomyces sp. NPDC051940 TaxID=3155675 RepID=UPI00342947E1